MKELIEVIAKSLVDHPSEVVVTETVSGDDLLLELKVDPSGTHCESNPYGCKSSFLKERQKSCRRNFTVSKR